MKIKRIAVLFGLAWAILISSVYWWNYSHEIEDQEQIALETSRSFFKHIVIARHWNASHRGVYVPVTEKTPPNQYLDVPMRDIVVNDNLTLTMVNPAFMTRQLSEIARKQDGVQFHITSLNPTRPQNQPTDIEVKFLNEFELGLKEKGQYIKDGEKSAYFYMAPLETEETCLSCHAAQGYKSGDIRGAISITLPFVLNIPIYMLLFVHIGIGLIGLIGIAAAGFMLNKSYKIIREQAVMDALTGIPNRRSFSESILIEFKRSQRSGQPLSVIMCDVDHFKSYNDTYGHDSGDLCLKEVAQSVKAALKRPGDVCARYGGEEFIVLLPNTSLDDAKLVSERIRSNIEKMGIRHEMSLPAQVVTLSLGVSTLEGTALNSHEELVKQADLALYKAKEQGRNQTQFFEKNRNFRINQKLTLLAN